MRVQEPLLPPSRRLTPWGRAPSLLFIRHDDDDDGGWEAAERQRVSFQRNTITLFHVLSSMPSSELSDALNPNVVRQRNYDDLLVYRDQQVHPNAHHPNFHYEQPQQPQYGYVPHRSELELAVVEPTPPQMYVFMLSQFYVVVTKRYRPRPTPLNPTHELLRFLASLKESERAEKSRRLAWERDQEVRLAQIREENERRIRTMQEEIDSLKEYIRHSGSATMTIPAASQNTTPDVPHESTPFQDLPQDHLSNQDPSYPSFVQGSSTNSVPYQGNGMLDGLSNPDDNTPFTRKRTTPPSSGDDENSEDDEPTNAQRPSKRINGHDTRCLTIQVCRVIPVTGAHR